ncbi:hypothetical protein Q9X96_003099 [Vibrio vulnificus]|nr:hypothetical protein [Vibrio vulnificus]
MKYTDFDFIEKDYLAGQKYDNLTVLGWVAKSKGNIKQYAVKCEICASSDPELYGDGIFVTPKSRLGVSTPCGCSNNFFKTPEQFSVLIKRASLVHGKDFVRYVDPDAKVTMKSRIIAKCKHHGDYNTGMTAFLNHNHCCPNCDTISSRISESKLKPWSFYESRVNKKCLEMGYKLIGHDSNWRGTRTRLYLECPQHGEWYSTSINDFVGILDSCCPMCAAKGYQLDLPGHFYYVSWKKGNNSFVKFGITNKPIEDRIRQQRRKTDYEPTIIFSRRFEDGRIPKKLESFIKSKLRTSVISKTEFGDGYTETIRTCDSSIIENGIFAEIVNLTLAK